MTTPATPATSAAPATGAENASDRRRCWPDDDRWHKGHTRIELPPEHLRAYWHAEILDPESKDPLTRIIERSEEFIVRFRVELDRPALEVPVRTLVLQPRLHALRGGRALRSL